MTYRNRLLLFLLLILAGLQAVSAVAVYGVIRSNLLQQGEEELNTTGQILTRQLNFISARVVVQVHLLALDFALRTAIAQGDRNTTISALTNHGSRIGAVRTIAIDPEGVVTADTTRTDTVGTAFPFPALLQEDSAPNKIAAVAALDGRAYWLIVEPVMAPVVIGFVAAAVPIDDVLLESLREISALPTSITLVTNDAAGRRSVVAHSNGDMTQTVSVMAGELVEPTKITDDGDQFLVWAVPLETVKNSQPVTAIL